MNEGLSMQGILAQLNEEGFALPEDYRDSADLVLQKKPKTRSAWYIRLFAGFSAWMAAVFLIAFLFLAANLDDETVALITGIVFISVALGINITGLRNDFMRQLGLALSLAGQTLFIVGLVSIFDDSFIVPLLIIAVEVVLIIAYRDRFHRFLSVVIIVVTILYVIIDQRAYDLVHILIFALAISPVLLYQREHSFLISGMDELVRPVGIGIAASLLGLLILPLYGVIFIQRWWITAILLLAVHLYLVWKITIDLQRSMSSGAIPWLLVGSVILAIPAIRMPGILGATIILLLGFWRNNRSLIGLASAFLLFYVSAFYYTLDSTLLEKSFALMATGVVLIGLRYVILRYRTGGAA